MEAMLASEVLGPVLGAAAGTVLNSMLSPSPQTPAVPTIAPPTGMPDPQAQIQAQQKSIAAQIARRGRASTILTQDQGGAGNKLGA